MKCASRSEVASVAARAVVPCSRPAVRCFRGTQTQLNRFWRQPKRSSIRVSRVSARAVYGSEWNTPKDGYLAVGLAHCYEKGDDGKVVDRFLIEPISANSLESMAANAKTCFKAVYGLTLEHALSRSKAVFPPEFAEATFCEEYETRCDSCARTWMRPHAMDNLLDIVPLGQLKSAFNYDTTDKRVINVENVVNDEDNIKQDLSIDVYGRKAKEGDEGAEAEPEPEEEDEMDSLLAA